MKKLIPLLLSIAAVSTVLTGCGSYTTAASVRTSTGQVLVGTTTASLSGGTFQVTDNKGLICNGTYNALDSSPTITAPLTCNDGRNGIVTVTRTPDGLSGSGTAQLSDGSTADVGFGKLASLPIAATPTKTASASAPKASTLVSATPTVSKRRTSNSTCYTGPRGGTYTITSGGNKNYSGC